MSGLDDVMLDVRSARRLVGLSGASVFLATRDEKQWFVRKIASAPERSARLRLQAARQRVFLERNVDGLTAPKILAEGEHDGLFWFDMELVRGLDGATHLARADFAAVKEFCDRVLSYLRCAARSTPIATPPSESLFEALYARVCDAHRKTGVMSDAMLSRVLVALDDLRACPAVAATLCHGDLTLENIVVGHDGRIYALDFLNGPAEHWWLDVAKLHQDLAGGWYSRHSEGGAATRIALGVINYVSERILGVAADLTPAYARVHNALLAATFVRILPYVTTDDARTFVLARIDHFTSAKAP